MGVPEYSALCTSQAEGGVAGIVRRCMYQVDMRKVCEREEALRCVAALLVIR